MKQLIADWSRALALVIVPGALVGAFLKRVNRRLPVLLVICIVAETLTSVWWEMAGSRFWTWSGTL